MIKTIFKSIVGTYQFIRFEYISTNSLQRHRYIICAATTKEYQNKNRIGWSGTAYIDLHISFAQLANDNICIYKNTHAWQQLVYIT